MRRDISALYYFLIIAAFTEGQVVRDALFLGHFKAVQLPYVDFAVAAIIGGILVLYMRIGRGTSLTNLLVVTLAVCFVNVVAFWWMAHLEKPTWLYPVVYIWVGIFGVLAVSQVWTLANYALSAREAKRLFGFIGSGGILARNLRRFHFNRFGQYVWSREFVSRNGGFHWAFDRARPGDP